MEFGMEVGRRKGRNRDEEMKIRQRRRKIMGK